MQNNIRKLSAAQKRAIASSAEIKKLNQYLYALDLKIIYYVRNAKNVTEAKQRAAAATTQITAFLQNVLVIAPPPADASADERAAANAARVAAAIAVKCPAGSVWDPVTETCVPA